MIDIGSLSEVAGLENSRVRDPRPKSALTNRSRVFMAWHGKARTSAPARGVFANLNQEKTMNTKTISPYSLSERAVIQRINRKLAHKYEKLCKSRGWRELQNLGDYHVIDSYRNVLIKSHVNIEELARELGVMADHERIEG